MPFEIPMKRYNGFNVLKFTAVPTNVDRIGIVVESGSISASLEYWFVLTMTLTRDSLSGYDSVGDNDVVNYFPDWSVQAFMSG